MSIGSIISSHPRPRLAGCTAFSFSAHSRSRSPIDRFWKEPRSGALEESLVPGGVGHRDETVLASKVVTELEGPKERMKVRP